MNDFCRPRRRLRDDLLQLALVALCPAIVVMTFPKSAFVRHSAPAAEASQPFCEFVALNEKCERKAVAAARTTWRGKDDFASFVWFDLLGECIPRAMNPVLPDCPAVSAIDVIRLTERTELLPPSLSAPPPVALPAQKGDAAAGPFFTREQMLSID